MNYPGMDPTFKHSVPVQIRFADIDLNGHVNNVVFQHYFDLAKLHYFTAVLGNSIDWTQSGLVQARVEIDFLFPVFLKDQIEVFTRCSRIGNKSLDILQEIRNKDTGLIHARGLSVMVGFSFEENCSVEIDQEWKNEFRVFEFPDLQGKDR
jgi:acyl-CoA thioester hydrolase